MKSIQQRVISGVGSLLLVTYAYAGSSAANVTIANLQINKGYPNTVFIKLNVPPTGKPTCSNHYWDYTLPLATAFDDKFYVSLLSAFTSESRIDVSGLGACNELSMIETMEALTLRH